jgi:hypothetical protein
MNPQFNESRNLMNHAMTFPILLRFIIENKIKRLVFESTFKIVNSDVAEQLDQRHSIKRLKITRTLHMHHNARFWTRPAVTSRNEYKIQRNLP